MPGYNPESKIDTDNSPPDCTLCQGAADSAMQLKIQSLCSDTQTVEHYLPILAVPVHQFVEQSRLCSNNSEYPNNFDDEALDVQREKGAVLRRKQVKNLFMPEDQFPQDVHEIVINTEIIADIPKQVEVNKDEHEFIGKPSEYQDCTTIEPIDNEYLPHQSELLKQFIQSSQTTKQKQPQNIVLSETGNPEQPAIRRQPSNIEQHTIPILKSSERQEKQQSRTNW
ncbi:MAG: hypothetical protein EZS28_012426 [Streblomastix strix]|uniref:Uncharacterized protein n=1 Tax=Streblomastix strix TaxID=222440 RepID=A0A5J4WCF1_9EUKA|nr:MAG: hypothetical protein EZS28_012426 [Streblomastix strix]